MTIDVAAAIKLTASVNGQQQVDKLAESLAKVGKTGEVSAAQTAAAFRILPAQFTDIATQLAGGQNPFLILLQQGGQIKDSFGGIGATFKAFASVLTPARLAIGGVGAAVGLLGKAFYDGQKDVDSFNKAVAMAGGFAGVSYTQYSKLAEKIALTTKESIGSGRELVLGALGTGQFGATSIGPVVQAMARYKEISGQTSDAVIKDFAAMANGVANWAAMHNRAMGYLTLEQYKYIQQLERQGKTEEAMAENSRLLNAELSKRTPQLGSLATAWQKVGNFASSAWDSMMNVGKPDTLESKLEEAQAALDRLRTRRIGRGSYKLEDDQVEDQKALARAKTRLAMLEQQAATEKKTADERAEAQAKNRKAVEEEASGLNDRKLTAGLSKRQSDLEAAAQERIRYMEFERLAVDSVHRRNEMSDSDYVQRITDIKRRQIAEEKALAEARVKVEEAQPTKDAAQEIQKAEKIAKARAEVRRLEQQSNQEQVKGNLDVMVIEDQKAKALRYYSEDLQFQIDMLKLQANQVNMTDFAYRQLVEAKQNEHDISVKTRDMVASEAGAYRAAAEGAFALRQGIEKINEAQSRTFEYGAKDALKKYADDAMNSARQAQMFFSNSFRSMEDALVDFAATGKANFRDMANSIIKDLIRIAIQRSITGPLANAFGGFFGGGSGGAVSAGASSGTGLKLPSFDVGTNYVPQDQIAMVHKGEAIIPAAFNKDSLGGSTSVVVNVSIDNNGNSSEQVSNNQGAGSLGAIIAGAVKAELINQKRPGGLLAA